MTKHSRLLLCLFIFTLSARFLAAFDNFEYSDKMLYQELQGKSFEYVGTRVVIANKSASSPKKIDYNLILKIAFYKPDVLDGDNPRILPGLIEINFSINSRSISLSKPNNLTTFYFMESFRPGLWAVNFNKKDELWHAVAQYFGMRKFTLKMPKVVAMRYSLGTSGPELVLVFGVGILETLHLREIS